MNSTTLSGVIGNGPTQSYTPTGTSIAKFSVAESRYDSAKKEKTTQWWYCTAFGQTAEHVLKFFTKGSWITVTGDASFSTYTTNEGQQRSDLRLTIDRVGFCGHKRDGQQEATHQPTQPPAAQPAPASDDIPF